jgi:hypothetical protein
MFSGVAVGAGAVLCAGEAASAGFFGAADSGVAPDDMSASRKKRKEIPTFLPS